MLATKRLAGVAPEVNLREHISCMPPPSVNKDAHFGFETQRRYYQKSKIGVSEAPQKGLLSSKTFILKKKQYKQAFASVRQLKLGNRLQQIRENDWISN